MEESPSVEPRAKRQKKSNFGKSAAFEKLKNLKGAKQKNKYEVSQMDNVFETVDEREYTKMVLSRQDDDWIVDDNGSGYVEDGRDIFDDDLDSESIAAAQKDKGVKRKKKQVSEEAGKGNLRFMISNMSTKKKEQVKLDEDNILSELISEIDTPSTSTTPIKPKPISSFSLSNHKTAANNYLKSFKAKPTPPKPKDTPKINYLGARPSENILKEIKQNVLKPTINMDEEEDIIPETPTKAPAVKVKEPQPIVAIETQETIEEFSTQEMREIEPISTDDQAMIEEFCTQEDIFTKEVEEEITEEQLLNGWETMQQGISNQTQMEVQVDASDLPTVRNEDGKEVFKFFWWDAFEDAGSSPGVVFLFGKTYCNTAKEFLSCCVVVRNIERKLYLLPRVHHKDNPDKPVAIIDVYHEFNNEFASKLYIDSFKSRKVSKNYCFDAEIPLQSDYLEVKYPASKRAIAAETCEVGGKTFSRIFGANNSFLERLLLECKIKGPCWLEIGNPEPVQNPISWCKYEVNCFNLNCISVVREPAPPPLVVAAINFRTAVNPQNLQKEIVMASFLVHTKYAVDKQPPNPMFERHFCITTRPKDQIFPIDFQSSLSKFTATKVIKVDSELALINFFATQMEKIDPDLLVGHDLVGYHITNLCDRLINSRVTNFSRIGRMKRAKMPLKKLLERQLFVGRLVCDLKISARELMRARSYDLDTLCQTVLNLKEGERTEIDIEEIPKMYQTSATLFNLITATMQDTAYALKMMYELNVIPLALQITNIAGNVMSRTLLGGRSERNEFLLLHAFAEKDYIVPDKVRAKPLPEHEEKRSARKKPTYSGGLVLDPKIGFYDTLILLMDFNSLYPSIIQEYNVCFTTIPMAESDQVVLPDHGSPPGILPTEIRKLVESRREVKKLMAAPDISPDLHVQYNIRQTALKLTANSMYGCLGFSNSRFYAKSLAALVTYKGREILTHTKELVEKMGYEVVYGDTDSIMINTHLLEYDQVIKIGFKIKQDVNKLYKQVELDIDGVFRYLLLLKKKKYAAIIISKDKTGKLVTRQEHKGLDIVRRDWSQLAAEAGRFTLQNILDDQTSEERIERILAHLTKLRDDLENGRVPLSLLVITKQLTKNPKQYPDKNQLPHVQVALR